MVYVTTFGEEVRDQAFFEVDGGGSARLGGTTTSESPLDCDPGSPPLVYMGRDMWLAYEQAAGIAVMNDAVFVIHDVRSFCAGGARSSLIGVGDGMCVRADPPHMHRDPALVGSRPLVNQFPHVHLLHTMHLWYSLPRSPHTLTYSLALSRPSTRTSPFITPSHLHPLSPPLPAPQTLLFSHTTPQPGPLPSV